MILLLVPWELLLTLLLLLLPITFHHSGVIHHGLLHHIFTVVMSVDNRSIHGPIRFVLSQMGFANGHLDDTDLKVRIMLELKVQLLRQLNGTAIGMGGIRTKYDTALGNFRSPSRVGIARPSNHILR